jgi:4-hydroxy-tetrahydrodipicolinate synthase
MLTGSLVALVTPMFADGAIDYDSLRRLVDFHIENCSNGIIAVGTTGESATLSVSEHISVVTTIVEHASGRIPVIAGAGGNSTAEAIELSRLSWKSGADYLLSVVPYYNKPTQEGLYLHYKAIADASKLPVIMYNVPGRTIVDMSDDTALSLASHPNIIGLKDATGDIGRACALIKYVPKDFVLYSGDDATSMAFMLCGGHGVISVTANLAPKLMSQLCKAATNGDSKRAREINDQLQHLHQQLFIEPNPIPVKWALNRMNRIPAGIRLPMTPLSSAVQASVESAMKQARVL